MDLDLPVRTPTSAMLRITMQDSTEAVTILVEGKLVGDWAKELEEYWERTARLRGHRALIIDLRETLFIDEEGRRVLTKLFSDGAFFRTSGPLTESIVSDITGGAKTENTKRVLRGAVMPALLLILAATFVKAQTPAPLRLTLRDAVQMALKQNPQVDIANLNVAVTQENLAHATGQMQSLYAK